MKKKIYVILMLILNITINCLSQSKSDIRVLIVAHNPDSLFTENYGCTPSARFSKFCKTRGQELKK